MHLFTRVTYCRNSACFASDALCNGALFSYLRDLQMVSCIKAVREVLRRPPQGTAISGSPGRWKARKWRVLRV